MFHPNLSEEDNALIYGITGGVPHYINKLDVRDSVDEALMENLFDRSSYLYEEPANLLKQELREPAIYNSIIEAIATGSSKFNEISQKIKEESSKCASYIKNLQEVRIINRLIPYGESLNSKRSIYILSDFFFRFWYKYVFANSTTLSLLGASKYTDLIYNDISQVLGLAFDTCS